MNYKSLYSSVTYDEDVTRTWLMNNDLLANTMQCKMYGSSCRLVKKRKLMLEMSIERMPRSDFYKERIILLRKPPEIKLINK